MGDDVRGRRRGGVRAVRVGRGVAVLGAIAAMLGAAMGCQAVAGLGDFTPDDDGATTSSGRGGAGGEAAASAQGGAPGDGGGTTGSSTSTGSTANTATVTSTSTSTGSGCGVDHVVISEVRTRGPEGGNQDFIELFNPTDATVVLDTRWRLDSRGEESATYTPRWTGDPQLTIGPGEHVLLANEEPGNPLGGATADALYNSGVPDGASVVLYRDDAVVDAVCFVCVLGELPADFECEGEPLSRDAGCQTGGDRSVNRRAAGGVAGCADTDVNAADLEDLEPSTPTSD